MQTKKITIPSISCQHCLNTIRNELTDLDGVQLVRTDAATKTVEVQWQEPASWEQIKQLLLEINYPPQENEKK